MAMRILIHFAFSEDEIETFRRIAGAQGDHEVLHATSEEDAIELAPQAEVLLGLFLRPVCAAAPKPARLISAGRHRAKQKGLPSNILCDGCN